MKMYISNKVSTILLNFVKIRALFGQNIKTARTEEPDCVEPKPKVQFQVEPIRTETGLQIKPKTVIEPEPNVITEGNRNLQKFTFFTEISSSLT